jgi:hypothetical protein
MQTIAAGCNRKETTPPHFSWYVSIESNTCLAQIFALMEFSVQTKAILHT